ncbi:hypothetical protein B296_00031248 [Ensete ventricosum]|uniref:Uncharacterized protein n=1 Tax=Ensete ventricosum TaxID=4639 RepID=A0A426ZRK3_ENSVE|nr:hypothetical protein B296_00031248 [Ensete ventricosum]
MHPLRFPNSGIRAKVFVRKIDFKLRVMRLYRVESFYAFLLRFRSEGSEEEGLPPMASPHAGSTTHGQDATKASPQGRQSPVARRPQRGRLQDGACKWRSPATSSQGSATRGQATSGGCPWRACKGGDRQ